MKKIAVIGPQTPQIFGLPELHKKALPPRTILSMSNSAYSHLTKWLVYVLSVATKVLELRTC